MPDLLYATESIVRSVDVALRVGLLVLGLAVLYTLVGKVTR